MSTAVIKDRDVKRGVERLLAAVGYSPAREKVFIKPNIVVGARGDSGVVTSPDVVRHLIRWLKGRGVRDITIGESPALFADVEECFRSSGYTRLAAEEGVELLNLDKVERREVAWKYGKLSLPEMLFDHSYINVAKIKTHVQTTVSLGIKNQKGLLLPKDKKKFHKLGLHGPIAELARLARPELTIVDGTIAMEGDGPIWGIRKRLDVLVGGTEPLEVDLACLRVMGIGPEGVEHIRLLLDGDVPGLEITGDWPAWTAKRFRLPDQESKRILRLVSWRSPDACTMCTYNTDLALKRIAKDPRNLFKLIKVFKGMFFTGMNLVYGKDKNIDKMKGRVVLIGNCAKVPYEGLDATKIPGCPPEVDDIIAGL